MIPRQRLQSMAAAMIVAASVLLPALPAAANIVDFDSLIIGTQYGVPTPLIPGDFAFAEDGADVYVDEFFVSGNPYFNYAQVDAPFLGFGSGNILWLNNISLIIDFGAPGDVSFQFLDLGGEVNIQVNGVGVIIEAPDFPSLGTFTIAPGVVMSTTWTSVGGGFLGTVDLQGPVEKLRVGGQELWVDAMDCDNGSAPDPCDYAVDYETLPLYAIYGQPNHGPGDYLFTEDGVDVLAMEFDYGGGLLFHQMEVVPAFGPFGPAQVMAVNNIDQLFLIGMLGITTATVTFEYLDYGGIENLQINNSPLMIGDLHTFSGMILGGVHVNVVTAPYGGGLYGQVTLTGNVTELRVGGQEFWMDDVCITEAGGPTECDLLVDHQSLAVGDAWGSPLGTPAGDVIFVEDGVPVTIGRLDAGGTPTYNYCEVVPAVYGVGNGNVMQINNVTNTYEIHATGITTAEVHFVYLDQGGIENLQVNGAPRYVGDLDLAPVNIAPGVTCSVANWMTGGGLAGHVVLTGDVQRLLVGGQEFFIDDVCIIGAVSAAPDAAATGVTLAPSYPNPFNPSTTLRYDLARTGHVTLAIHDMAGRVVRTLVDAECPAGPHTVRWDGRGERGQPVPAGIYLVRVASGKETDIQKIALIK